MQVPLNMTECTRKDSFLEYFNCIHSIKEVLFRKVLPEVLNRKVVYQCIYRYLRIYTESPFIGYFFLNVYLMV